MVLLTLRWFFISTSFSIDVTCKNYDEDEENDDVADGGINV